VCGLNLTGYWWERNGNLAIKIDKGVTIDSLTWYSPHHPHERLGKDSNNNLSVFLTVVDSLLECNCIFSSNS